MQDRRLQDLQAGALFLFHDPMLGSNDPNTIPDPTRIRCSRVCIVSYVSARTPFLFGLSYDLCFSRTPYFPVTFSRDFLDICFMLDLSPFPYVSLMRTMFHTFTFSDSAVTLDPSLLYFTYRTQIPFSYPAPAHPLVSIYTSCTRSYNLRTNITCLSSYLSEVPSERSETPVRLRPS